MTAGRRSPDPVLVLGPPRSGGSLVTGFLHRAAGLRLGEQFAPTLERPAGEFESTGIVDAHRHLLRQLERDVTCPPGRLDPSKVEVDVLYDEIDRLANPGFPWVAREQVLTYCLPAWTARVPDARLVAVVRPEHDAARSIEHHDGLSAHWAQALVEAHVARLVRIAEQTELAVIEYTGSREGLLEQTRAIAVRLGLVWDDDAAGALFLDGMSAHSTDLRSPSPGYVDLLALASQGDRPIASTHLAHLEPGTEAEPRLPVHLGDRYVEQQRELWGLAEFAAPEPDVVELVLAGGRRAPARPVGSATVERIEIASARAIGPILSARWRPDAIIAHGLLRDQLIDEIERFFASTFSTTAPFADLIVDVPSANDGAQRSFGVDEVIVAGQRAGWELVERRVVSAGRVGAHFRKTPPADHTTGLMVQLDAQLGRLIAEHRTRVHDLEHELRLANETIEFQRTRADRTQRDFDRLRRRRSVRIALRLAGRTTGLLRLVRRWRRST